MAIFVDGCIFDCSDTFMSISTGSKSEVVISDTSIRIKGTFIEERDGVWVVRAGPKRAEVVSKQKACAVLTQQRNRSRPVVNKVKP